MSSRGRPKKIGRPAGGEAGLVDLAAEVSSDPFSFVIAAFPWKEPNTELADYDGPFEWQVEVLKKIRDDLMNPTEALRYAISAGNGPGKSSLVSWLILWGITTCPDARGVVTANTETQLKTKTWAELAKWHRLSLWSHWFKLTATSIYSNDPEHERTWRIDAVPWSEKNTEAFAGMHNQGKRIIVLFDEASNIPDVIYETTEGALTDKDTEIIWLLSGNPTKNTGRFRECWSRFKHRWTGWQIDTRTVPNTNKEQIAQWAEDYGDDSDYFRIHVKGEFPRTATSQFISGEVVEQASKRPASCNVSDALVLGVDVARFGDDASTIYIRKGRDARTHPPRKFRGLDTMQLAAQVAIVHDELRPDAIFVDETGLGAGVVDRLRQLRIPCLGIHFGSGADGYGDDKTKYANKRAEMWGLMRDWLKGGAIPDDKALTADLVGVEYGFNNRNEIQLEKKDDMRKRGLPSPDDGDGLALTFAHPVQAHDHAGGAHQRRKPGVQHDYDPFAGSFLEGVR